MSKKFALIGAAGFVAPRHMKAIYDTGNDLIAALDPHDSVGILDKYFPNCEFFTEMERFDRHLEKSRRTDRYIDYVSICSPNYLHEPHCRLAMRIGADTICEKPLVLNPHNLDQLSEIELETGKKIYTVLQLRLHPELKKIKENLDDRPHTVRIEYITPRGNWYHSSWKGNEFKSGGLATNIGIHLFDLVMWLFGSQEDFTLIENTNSKVKGILWLERAKVNFKLSVDRNDLPDDAKISYRLMTIDGEPVRFDNVFTELHTEVYKKILEGRGFGIEDARPSIELVSEFRKVPKTN
jgi:UDP-N-acetyl-2-amino-2-deoxyglucuronate dehydrogenase